MPEYIEREDVIKKISGLTVNISGGRRKSNELAIEVIKAYHKAVLQCVNVSPAVDVVKVVMCGQCKHFYEYPYRGTNNPSGWGKCKKIGMDIDLAKNDFCSYGEKKE